MFARDSQISSGRTKENREYGNSVGFHCWWFQRRFWVQYFAMPSENKTPELGFHFIVCSRSRKVEGVYFGWTCRRCVPNFGEKLVTISLTNSGQSDTQPRITGYGLFCLCPCWTETLPTLTYTCPRCTEKWLDNDSTGGDLNRDVFYRRTTLGEIPVRDVILLVIMSLKLIPMTSSTVRHTHNDHQSLVLTNGYLIVGKLSD